MSESIMVSRFVKGLKFKGWTQHKVVLRIGTLFVSGIEVERTKAQRMGRIKFLELDARPSMAIRFNSGGIGAELTDELTILITALRYVDMLDADWARLPASKVRKGAAKHS